MHRILAIVEDPEVENLLRDRLAKHHHRLHVVHGPPLQLDQLRELEPQVILLDLSRDGAGVQVRRALLSDPVLAPVPVVVLAKTADEARALAAHAYFSRPFDPDALIAVIEALAQAHLGIPAA